MGKRKTHKLIEPKHLLSRVGAGCASANSAWYQSGGDEAAGGGLGSTHFLGFSLVYYNDPATQPHTRIAMQPYICIRSLAMSGHPESIAKEDHAHTTLHELLKTHFLADSAIYDTITDNVSHCILVVLVDEAFCAKIPVLRETIKDVLGMVPITMEEAIKGEEMARKAEADYMMKNKRRREEPEVEEEY